MKTVNEVSKLTGISVRTLHHYDEIGLLTPTAVTEAGYRLYDDTALERLQHILLFRELEFPLKDIKDILDSPDFERNKAYYVVIRFGYENIIMDTLYYEEEIKLKKEL
jgi:DNA-binding transcriptional MerR regulator